MWRFWEQTRREKQGMIDGINLFFGALLGANLGSIGALSTVDYTSLVIVLAGAVVTLRIFSTSERRGYAYLLLAIYAAMVVTHLYVTPETLENLGAHERDRLALTLVVWLGSIVLTELSPITKADRDGSGDPG